MDQQKLIYTSYYSDHEGKVINDENVESSLVLADPLCQQVVDLTSTNQAIIDTYRFLQQKIKVGETLLDQAIVIYRKLADKEFDNKILLKKCELQFKRK